MSGDDRSRLDHTTALPGHMAELESSKATGILAAATENARREILWVNGEIRAARSSFHVYSHRHIPPTCPRNGDASTG